MDTRALIQRWQDTQDKAIEAELLRCFLPDIKLAVQRLRHSVDREDLLQLGYLGFRAALTKFRGDLGLNQGQIRRYIIKYAWGYASRYVREERSVLHIPHHVKRFPQILHLEALDEQAWKDKEVEPEECVFFEDSLPSEQEAVDDALDRLRAEQRMPTLKAKLLSVLDSRTADCLTRSFAEEKETLQEIGTTYCISRSRANQILNDALSRLHRYHTVSKYNDGVGFYGWVLEEVQRDYAHLVQAAREQEKVLQKRHEARKRTAHRNREARERRETREREQREIYAREQKRQEALRAPVEQAPVEQAPVEQAPVEQARDNPVQAVIDALRLSFSSSRRAAMITAPEIVTQLLADFRADGRRKQIEAGARGREGGRGRKKSVTRTRAPATRDRLGQLAGVSGRTIDLALLAWEREPERMREIATGHSSMTVTQLAHEVRPAGKKSVPLQKQLRKMWAPETDTDFAHMLCEVGIFPSITQAKTWMRDVTSDTSVKRRITRLLAAAENERQKDMRGEAT